MTYTSSNPKNSDAAILSDQLSTSGYCILPNVVDKEALMEMRKIITANLDMMPNTRNSPHSRHMAGFERFSEFEPLFSLIDGNQSLNNFFSVHFGDEKYSSFGLSDITVNRSQHWHTDLLRGQFAHYLDDLDPWSPDVGSCVKALVYLQDGKSLKVASGSHLANTPLDDKLLEQLVPKMQVDHVEVAAGDIVMMDIRSLHRGPTETEMAAGSLANNPKILVSNVYAETSSALGKAMKVGNDHRLDEWCHRHMRSVP